MNNRQYEQEKKNRKEMILALSLIFGVWWGIPILLTLIGYFFYPPLFEVGPILWGVLTVIGVGIAASGGR